MPLLVNWLVHRQMKLEGGFSGRTNKLVDSCYSFWQGGALAITTMIERQGDDLSDMRKYMSMTTKTTGVAEEGSVDAVADEEEYRVIEMTGQDGSLLFQQEALQRYVLYCGQQQDGGLRGK